MGEVQRSNYGAHDSPDYQSAFFSYDSSVCSSDDLSYNASNLTTDLGANNVSYDSPVAMSITDTISAIMK